MGWVAKQYVVGDRHPDIAAAKVRLRKIAEKLVGDRLPVVGGDDVFSPVFGEVYREWKAAVHRDVDRGRRPGPDLDPASTAIDWAAKVQLGIIARATPSAPVPAPARARHAALVYRGTGGVVGLDYVSRVCQGAADLVEEINPDYPASMGGLPPGAPGTPSANDAIRIGVESGARWIEQNPTRTFLLGGYSLGEIVVARLLELLFTPGARLYPHRHRFVASFHIGPPARPLGGAYFGGTAAPGVGIASHRLPIAVLTQIGARACYLAHPDDMYASIPVPVDGGTGDIMETVYDMVTDAALSDPLGTVQTMVPHMMEIVTDAGILPGGPAGLLPIGGALLGGPLAIVPLMLPMLVAALPGLIAGIGGGAGANLTGPAAAAQAAILGMKFLMTGTAPHIEYHVREVWPGQTYLGLAIQHVRDWAGRTPVTA